MRRGEQGPQGTAGEGVDSLTASSEGVGKAALRGAANDGVGRPTRRRHRQTREVQLAARALAALRGTEGEGVDSPMRCGKQQRWQPYEVPTAGEGVDSLTASSKGVGKAALRGAAKMELADPRGAGIDRPVRRG